MNRWWRRRLRCRCRGNFEWWRRNVAGAEVVFEIRWPNVTSDAFEFSSHGDNIFIAFILVGGVEMIGAAPISQKSVSSAALTFPSGAVETDTFAFIT